MDKLLSSVGLDPTKIKLDSNVNISQDHINQLFAGIAPLLKKFQADAPLSCDAECQKNELERYLYEKYLAARDNAQNAPEEYEEAERKFFLISNKGQSYVDYKETEATTEIKDIVDILSKNFDEKIGDIQERIYNLKGQMISSKHMKELGESYGRDINQIDSEIERVQDKSNLNDRLAVYYSRQITLNRNYLFYIKILYWVALTVYISYFAIFKEFYDDKIIVVICTFLVLAPFVFKPIVTYFFPVKVYLPPPERTCPTKLVSPIPIDPPPPKIDPFDKPGADIPIEPPSAPQCPQQTVWSIIKNSLPSIGQPNAKAHLKARISNLEDDISLKMSPITNKIKAVTHSLKNII